MRKHRKLFPIPHPTNGTECSDFCNDAFRDFYFLQPPPPTVAAERDNGFSVSPLALVLLTLLACLLLVLLYYVVVSRSCLGLFRRRRRRDHDLDGELAQSDVEEPADEHGHPIWLISTVGLQQPVINSITVVTYRKGEGLIEGTDCSVCLSEFREHETLRLLPKCSHAFHVPCIDTWLRSHTNCPLCRARIVAPATRNDAVVAPARDDAALENDVVRPVLRLSASAGNLSRSRGVGVKKRSLSCGGNILFFETK